MSNKWAVSCGSFKSSLKDCSVTPVSWCSSRSFIACSRRPLDRRVCRKENKVPCSATTCALMAPCVDGDDTVIPKGHSYCRNCPTNYYGDGDNCTGTVGISCKHKVQCFGACARQFYWSIISKWPYLIDSMLLRVKSFIYAG